ncbi:hypothetical protein CSUI_007116 [Cystoisospora suis]|uniref:Transmembrane protein n=1 Tax=Cystoisospora suis TaxID=483139 RepID=A0A2C6KRP1_9APIC|nr:hypothetical protein CSUI_007116 [Cystoisospora suis]
MEREKKCFEKHKKGEGDMMGIVYLSLLISTSFYGQLRKKKNSTRKSSFSHFLRVCVYCRFSLS